LGSFFVLIKKKKKIKKYIVNEYGVVGKSLIVKDFSELTKSNSSQVSVNYGFVVEERNE